MATKPMTERSVSAVIFDFGGVISDDPFRTMGKAAIEFGFDLADFRTIAIGDYGSGDHAWHKLERGEIELADYNASTDALAKQRGHAGFPPLPIDMILNQILVVRPAMLELMGELRACGIATAILTNNVRALGAWRDSADWEQLVDAVIDSCEVGMRKPEPRIFEYACAHLGVALNESVFLDDMVVNVDAAAALEMTAVLVADPAEAIATVRQLVAGRSMR